MYNIFISFYLKWNISIFKYFERIIYYNKNYSIIIKSFYIHYYKYKINGRNL